MRVWAMPTRECMDPTLEQTGSKVQDYGQVYLSAGLDQASVIGTKLQALTVPLPALAGQIVAEVERCLSVINELEATVEANLIRTDHLRQSVLASASVGRLVCVNANR